MPTCPLPSLGDDTDVYHLLCVGYALDLLGPPGRPRSHPSPRSTPPGWSARWRTSTSRTTPGRPATAPTRWAPRSRGSCGRAAPCPDGVVDALLGWLLVHRDPGTGLWGVARDVDGLRLPVNGFYRTVRGTFAQLGVDLPGTEATIDAILRHAADPRTFGPGR